MVCRYKGGIAKFFFRYFVNRSNLRPNQYIVSDHVIDALEKVPDCKLPNTIHGGEKQKCIFLLVTLVG